MNPVAPRQSGPHVWHGADLDDGDWIWHLDPTDHDEVVTAARTGNHHLPGVGPKLDALAARLTHGRGFELIRGLDVATIGPELAADALLTIGRRLGSLRSQNAAGDLLGQVRNAGLDAANPDVRIYQTNQRQTFHTDSADVVALLCLNEAAEGGDSMLVSAAAIYNEMFDRDLELAHALFETVATDRRGEVPAGEDPYFLIPVLNWYDNALTVIYQRQYIDSAARFDTAPPLTSRQRAALDLFDEIANRPDMHVSMRLQPGDMQFVHNHSLLHDRTAFTDDPAAPRHLLRLWLSMPGDRELPPIFASRYGSITVGDRGGIIVEDGVPQRDT
ncbi:MAG: TauD/TfdA family dioxygenase [Actinomycetota bacterium]